MSTGKDYGLPEEYADWVEVDAPQSGEYVAINIGRFPAASAPIAAVFRFPTDTVTSYFVPPKPKPTLPEVEEGAVIRFRSKAGSIRRAIRGRFNWRVFEKGTPVVYHGTDFADPTATDAYLLNDVDDDGFTVELDGLE